MIVAVAGKQYGSDRITSRRGDTVAAVPAVSTGDDARLEHDLAVQRATFDYALEQRTEFQRELNDLHTLSMQQMKVEDEFVKDWIRLI